MPSITERNSTDSAGFDGMFGFPIPVRALNCISNARAKTVFGHLKACAETKNRSVKSQTVNYMLS